jgi:tRNA(Arg) A34 adenosine deaminase TadA
VTGRVPAPGAARAAFDALDHPWQVALREAWTSWAGGSAGVGAVVSRRDGTIVAAGRNRMLEPRTEPGVLASTYLAHAEMNALALVPLGPTDDLVLSTTFEPCLMCASTIVQQRIPYVRYAAADPLFDGMHDWFGELPFASERRPTREELGGRVGAFAHVLHVAWLAFWTRDTVVLDAHRRLRPRHLDLALDVVRDEHLADVARAGGDVVDALTAMWDSLGELTGAR